MVNYDRQSGRPAQLAVRYTGARGGNAFMVLDLAIGGYGGGPVPESFTQSTMTVDYVRVW
jgi:hypothetical protein